MTDNALAFLTAYVFGVTLLNVRPGQVRIYAHLFSKSLKTRDMQTLIQKPLKESSSPTKPCLAGYKNGFSCGFPRSTGASLKSIGTNQSFSTYSPLLSSFKCHCIPLPGLRDSTVTNPSHTYYLYPCKIEFSAQSPDPTKLTQKSLYCPSQQSWETN